MEKIKRILFIVLLLFLLSSFVSAIDVTKCIGYWTMDDADISGSTYDDLSSKNHDGTANEAITSINGKISEARNFTGSDTNYISMGDVNDYEATTTFSVTSWVNVSKIITVASGGQYPISKQLDVSNWHGWIIMVRDADSDSINELEYYCDTSSGGDPYVTGLEIPINIWTFIALVINTTHSCTSVNAGALSCVASVCGYENTVANFAISGRNGGGWQDYSEDIDEIAVWNKTLTSAELSELYNGGAGLSYPFTTGDSITPIIKLILTNNSWQVTRNLNFTFNATTNDNFKNCSVWTNETSWSLKHSNLSAVINNTIYGINETFSSDSNFLWNIYCCDTFGNCAFNNTNYTIKIDSTPPRYNSNVSNTTLAYNLDYVLLMVNFTDSIIGLNYTWIGNNFTGTWLNETPIARNSVLNYNHTNITRITVGDNRTICWRGYANDSLGNFNQTNIACFDTKGQLPLVTLVLPTNANTENSYSVTFTFNATTNDNFADCSLYDNETSWSIKSSNTSQILNNTNSNLNKTYSAEGIYVWNVYCCDLYSNCNFSVSNYTLTVSIPITSGISGTIEGLPTALWISTMGGSCIEQVQKYKNCFTPDDSGNCVAGCKEGYTCSGDYICYQATTNKCEQKETFLGRLKDSCSYNNSICEDAETPLVSDCEITTDSISCKGDRCIFNEIWFAKIVLIVLIILIVTYKKEYQFFIALGMLFLIISFSNVNIGKPIYNQQITNTTVEIPQEMINDNLMMKYGSKILPKNPTVGFLIIVIILFLLLRYLFSKVGTRWEKR
jgi:hypothetical protein